MSYRSFKRVLGETSLERKCRFLFGACLFLLITGSFLWYGTQTEKLVYQQNPAKGRVLVGSILALMHWKEFKPADDALTPSDAFVREDEAYKNELLENLGRQLQNEQYSWTVILPEARDGRGMPQDEWEWRILDRFKRQGPLPEDWAHRRPTNRPEYAYYQAIFAQRICTRCHVNSAGPGAWAAAAVPSADQAGIERAEVGQLLGIVKVTMSDQATQTNLNRNRAVLLAIAFITVSLAMLAAYIIVRYVIVKPLKHLRDVSDAVRDGNVETRSDIRTGDEFEELGTAFNRMLRHLVDTQGELQKTNGELDHKVDQLAQLNMRLFEMNRVKSDFLATMSHELRTPLNSIIGFSDVLSSIQALDEKQKRYVLNIKNSGKALLDMINDILDLAKIEAGRSEIRVGDFKVESLISAQCDMARPLTERKNIDLEIDCEPDLPTMHSDQSKVQQILNNLLSNAIKFTPEGGRIRVEACNVENRLELVVADTGVGISEEDRTTIFEKFRQGKSVLPTGDAMTREYSGTGLGLSIVKELCKLLGGEVRLESQLGKGSEFTVELPWTISEAPRVEQRLSDEIDDFARGPLRTDFERPTGVTAGA